ncbi:MAG: DUF4214 domain-containing protein [Pseudomonadota bacterium]|nr:DUF4214 domain-containing protein [Pseudomonadota bacterium]
MGIARIDPNSVRDGYLQEASADDVFVLAVEQGWSYRIDLLSSDGSLDPLLSVYEASSGRVFANDDVDHNGGNFNASLGFTAAASGDVYIDVSSWGDITFGGYRLVVNPVGHAYDSSSFLFTDVDMGIFERARTVVLDQPHVGSIDFSGDIDMFRLDVVAGRSYAVDLSDLGAGLDVALEVFGANGHSIGFNDDRGDGSLNSRVHFTAEETGSVYLEAFSHAGTIGAYRLDVNGGYGDDNQGSDHLNGLSPNDAKEIAYLYEAALGRQADVDGLNFWIDQKESGFYDDGDIALEFVGSTEFRGRFGDPEAMTNQDFVERLYLNVLDRPGETAGVAFWTRQIDTGMDWKELLWSFATSEENTANSQYIDTLTDDGSGWWYFA